MAKHDLILHPVRLQILVALGGTEKTIAQIAQALPEVAQATLYRHMSALVDGGILKITDETPIRGTVERTYALADDNIARLNAEDIAGLTIEEHQRYFSIFAAMLLTSFSRYLEATDSPDYARDGVGYHITELHINPDEYGEFAERLSEALAPYLTAAPGTKRTLFSTILIPGDTEQ
jgi:DNA-binding transcriptional ArsR family regulator